MAGGNGLKGGRFTIQAVLIVPVPASATRYYVFTTKSVSDTNPEGEPRVYASMVDVSTNGGLGHVIQESKNTQLHSNGSEFLIAIPHTNGQDYWLLTRDGVTKDFVIFPITSAGIGEPSVTSFGVSYVNDYARGYLQAAPNGTMVACAVSSDGYTRNPMELYDFDAATGMICNRRVLGEYPELTGTAFSPDNSKLYFTYYDQLNFAKGELIQMDLEQSSLEDIIESATNLHFVHEPFPDNPGWQRDTLTGGVLQLAPDGRLYAKMIAPYSITENGQRIERRKIYYLDNPNGKGLLAQPKGRDFIADFSGPNEWSFPNLMPHYFNGLLPQPQAESEGCTNEMIVVYPNPTTRRLDISFSGDCAVPVKVSLVSIHGQILGTYTITQPFYTLDLASLAPSLYMLVFETNDRQKFIRKIIRQRKHIYYNQSKP